MARKSKQEIMAIIGALLLAFVMWIYAMAAKNPTETKTVSNIPVQLINVEALAKHGLALDPEQNFVISLDIEGKALDVYSANNPNYFKVVADLNSAIQLGKGENNIPIEIQDLPKGVQIDNPTGIPYYIKVKLEKLEKKSVPVTINLTGTPKKGYGSLEAIKTPTEIVVTGPESLVNSVSSIVGEIDINTKASDAHGSIVIKPLNKDGEEVKNVTMERQVVDVTVPIKLAKEVEIIVKTKGRLDDNKVLRKMNPTIKKVTILGDRKYLDKVDEIQTVVYDISTISSTITDTISLNLPEGIDVFQGISTVDVEFIVENKQESSIKIPVNLINSNSEYNYSTSIADINVFFEGAESLVNAVDVEDINATVDVSNLGEGQHNLTIKLTLPNGIELVKATPEKVVVTISKLSNSTD